MIETNFKKQMDRIDDLLAEIKGSKSQLPTRPTVYTYKCLMVLCPENYKWQAILLNLYNPTEIDRTQGPPVGTTVVIHGHEFDQNCYANTFCHVLGYQPENGSKFWNMKWGTTLYATTVTNGLEQLSLLE